MSKNIDAFILREKCPYSEFSSSRIWTEYGEIIHISPYSVLMWGNTDQKTSEYGRLVLGSFYLNTLVEL